MTRSIQLQSIRVFVLVAFLLVATTALPMQGTPTRVRFPRGRTSVVLKGSVKGTKQYVLRAKEGQTMSVRLTSPGHKPLLDVHVRGDKGAIIAERESGDEFANWVAALPKSGDYVISVKSVDTPNMRYTLEISFGFVP